MVLKKKGNISFFPLTSHHPNQARNSKPRRLETRSAVQTTVPALFAAVAAARDSPATEAAGRRGPALRRAREAVSEPTTDPLAAVFPAITCLRPRSAAGPLLPTRRRPAAAPRRVSSCGGVQFSLPTVRSVSHGAHRVCGGWSLGPVGVLG
jgi:hypothetical protein